ncbi:MAG: aspartate/glutamate racemase family protein, partial [Halobellus sp.]
MTSTIGVVGGMGNEAMADLAANLDDFDGSADHSYVFYGNSRQAFTPAEADDEWEEGDVPLLRKRHTGEFTAALLEALGAGRVGLACNDAHPLYRDIFADRDAEFVDMIAETARVPDGDDGVLVLGTKRTLQKRIYDDDLEAAGIETFQPTPENRSRLMDVIYDPEFGIKTGEVTERAEGLLC